MTVLRGETGRTDVRVLDIAERLVQTRGFNDFSYADIASELGITKAALHYHFASKAALGDAVVQRYSARFFAELERVEREVPGTRERLAAYVDIYRRVLASGRLCLCGILAAEYQSLPAAMRDAVRSFFARNTEWLDGVLRQGVDAGELAMSGSTSEVAALIIDTLEGAMMVARANDDPDRFDQVSSRLLSMIGAD